MSDPKLENDYRSTSGTLSPLADDPDAVPVRPAATVMLVRDGDDGLEVFLQQRNHGSEFVAGLHVFPGGGVDEGDSAAAVLARCRGRDDADASERVGVDDGGLAFWVAAIRETFEEAGLLLAYDRDGGLVELTDSATVERFAKHRVDVDKAETTLVSVCEAEDLTLAVDTMHYHSRWITPIGPKRRYDTRFFVAPAPTAQVASNDAREAIADLWTTPGAALDGFERGELGMLTPTLLSLRDLAAHQTVEAVLTASAARRDIEAILPKRIIDGDTERVILPNDPGYDEL